MNEKGKAQLDALKNMASSLMGDFKAECQMINAKAQPKFYLTTGCKIISPVLNYDKLNHLLLGLKAARDYNVEVVESGLEYVPFNTDDYLNAKKMGAEVFDACYNDTGESILDYMDQYFQIVINNEAITLFVMVKKNGVLYFIYMDNDKIDSDILNKITFISYENKETYPDTLNDRCEPIYGDLAKNPIKMFKVTSTDINTDNYFFLYDSIHGRENRVYFIL